MTIRLGLLVGDYPVDDQRLSLGGGFPEVFENLFERFDIDVTLEAYSIVEGEFPVDLTSVDGWIVTGSRYSAYDDEPWIHRLSDLIRTVHGRVPLVGICFGHQMIARALGGQVGLAPQGRGIGVLPAHVALAEPWMDPPLDTVRLIASHQDQVLALPPGGRILAGSDFCPVAIYAIGDTTLGIQNHPEFTPAIADALLSQREDQIDATDLKRARASLAGPTDEGTVATWISLFVNGATEELSR
ncbi:MAG: hypothetical protein U9N78_03680 [Actinomycetota bacterium]|nr:hypothetical protein [Actinomycetota bacterium]